MTWTMFASLLVSTSLHAVCLAAGGGMVFYLLGSWWFLGGPIAFIADPWMANRQFPIAFHAAALGIMMLANVVLSRRWLMNRPWIWEFLFLREGSTTSAPAMPLRDTRTHRSSMARTMHHLLWLQARQGVRFSLILWAVGIPLTTFLFAITPPRELWFPDAALPFAVFMALARGWSAFQADKRDGRYRFLGERGVSPTIYWLTSQLVWLSVAILQLLVFLAIGYFVVRHRFLPAGTTWPGQRERLDRRPGARISWLFAAFSRWHF
ncbi:MAG: hypothetical protein U1D30_14290 [Planctomycetota bacterium]